MKRRPRVIRNRVTILGVTMPVRKAKPAGWRIAAPPEYGFTGWLDVDKMDPFGVAAPYKPFFAQAVAVRPKGKFRSNFWVADGSRTAYRVYLNPEDAAALRAALTLGKG